MSIIILMTGSHGVVMISVSYASTFDYSTPSIGLLSPNSRLQLCVSTAMYSCLVIYMACSGKEKFHEFSTARGFMSPKAAYVSVGKFSLEGFALKQLCL